ncbi:dUTP diphosphatase [Patescibacteria group bacterium]|nr:dUTP diphosphatase [Patescibacteria group bacterium]
MSKSQKILIKQFDTTLPLPCYKTTGAAAFDLAVRQDVEIAPHSTGIVPLNVAIKPPDGHWALLAARSSLWKRGLMLANGLGIMDQDYCGNEDEYRAVVYNFTAEVVRIEKGDRIAQVVILPYAQWPIETVENLDSPSRGGFGTTGIK